MAVQTCIVFGKCEKTKCHHLTVQTVPHFRREFRKDIRIDAWLSIYFPVQATAGRLDALKRHTYIRGLWIVLGAPILVAPQTSSCEKVRARRATISRATNKLVENGSFQTRHFVASVGKGIL